MPDYPTQSFDNLRTGWNSQETILTPAAIKQRGLVQAGTCTVQGQVYAQPLVVEGITFPDGSKSNVLLIATEENRIYGFDGYTQAKKWERQLLVAGEHLVLSTEVACDNIAPTIGITSTPVVDLHTKTMYVCAKSKKPGVIHHYPTTFHYRLYRINIHDGVDATAPVEITGTVTVGGKTIAFNPRWQLQRPGLLLMNGIIYIGFGSHCDQHALDYHGWVFAYDTTLNQKGVFVATTTGQGGIWQSGRGLAGDGTSVYCTTGNSPNLTSDDHGDSVLKLQLGTSLQLVDSFTSCDQALLQQKDADLGSGGPILLPDQPGPFPHILVVAGKEGTIYVLNRDNLGGFNAAPAGWTQCDVNMNPTPCADSAQVIQSLWMVLGQAGKCDSLHTRDALFGGPAYFAPDTQTGVNTSPRIYFCAQDDVVRSFYIDTTTGKLVPHQQANEIISAGAIPVVSSNAGKDGILWVAARAGAPNMSRQLFAYDLNPSLSLSDPSALLVNGINAGAFSPEGEPAQSPSLAPPATVVDGNVYVAGLNQVLVFALGTSTGGSCFIATAVMDEKAPSLTTLRTFRDQFLATKNSGRLFIRCYERIGPALAGFIRKSKLLRILTRIFVAQPAAYFASALLALQKSKER